MTANVHNKISNLMKSVNHCHRYYPIQRWSSRQTAEKIGELHNQILVEYYICLSVNIIYSRKQKAIGFAARVSGCNHMFSCWHRLSLILNIKYLNSVNCLISVLIDAMLNMGFLGF